LTTFIGREAEMAEIRRRLTSNRLVTLTGAGGAGKTRLAVQVGAEILNEYSDGVWFVELATLTDGGLLAQVVARTLGISESMDEPIMATLTGFLRERRALLIFDNCEHVIASAATAADALLRACSRIQILATSREGLGVAGE